MIVIGGGIVGLATARELLIRNPELELTLLERAPSLAAGQTGSSSGVIHAGIYYAPGSLKARLCVEGMRDTYAYCAEKGIAAEPQGKLIVATSEEELPRLEELERRGRENGVPELRRLAGDEIAEIEPHARGLAALHSPRTGVVDFVAVAEALAGDVRAAGGEIALGAGARKLIAHGGKVAVEHGGGMIRARFAVASAGAGSAALAVSAGAPADPRIVPFRGGYLRLRPDRAGLVKANIYPVPDPELPFLGAHLTRTHEGEVLLGPSALMVGGFASPGSLRMAWRHRRAAAGELRRAASRRAFAAEAARMVPELRASDFERGPSGVRAQAMNSDGTLVDDFVVHETEHALHVRNAPSPAATSALPLARMIADRVEERITAG